MESIKMDLSNLIDEYMRDIGGDITPLQHLKLSKLLDDLSSLLLEIIIQNQNSPT